MNNSAFICIEIKGIKKVINTPFSFTDSTFSSNCYKHILSSL